MNNDFLSVHLTKNPFCVSYILLNAVVNFKPSSVSLYAYFQRTDSYTPGTPFFDNTICQSWLFLALNDPALQSR